MNKGIMIITANFYQNYEQMLLDAAIAELGRVGMGYEVIKVPGCFEIPAALAMAIKSSNYAGFIVLGCVIKGQTSHYDYVCAETMRGIGYLSVKHNIALGTGIITALDDVQAEERANPLKKNLGAKAALACIDMMTIQANLKNEAAADI